MSDEAQTVTTPVKRKRGRPKGSRDPKGLLEATRRYKAAKATIEEYRRDLLTGKLIKVEDVKLVAIVAGQTMQNGVRELVARLPESLAMRDSKQVAIILETEFRRLLKQFAENLGKMCEVKSEPKL